MTAAAGKVGPAFFVLLLFSFWLYRRRSPVDTLSHKGLWSKHTAFKHTSWFIARVSVYRKHYAHSPGSALEPGFPTRPLARMTSTSSAPFFSTIPIWMSPTEEQQASLKEFRLSVTGAASPRLKCVYTEAYKCQGLCSPIGGVANVCLPTSWAGPSPSRKSLNWLSEESLTPGKMRLRQRKICMFVKTRKCM